MNVFIRNGVNETKLIVTGDDENVILGYIVLTELGMECGAELVTSLTKQSIPAGEKPNYYVIKDIVELTGALESLVNTYLANQGTSSEFVSCITPKGIPWYWIRAKQAIERGYKYLERK